MTAGLVKENMEGRVCLVTGANAGIGRVSALELSRAGAEVFLACRSEERARPVLEEIKALGRAPVHFLSLDLGDLDSVRACAAAFLETGKPLHVLLNNAGLAGQKGKTKSGFELSFGVNHVGHFLLTLLLMDRLKESAPARVVTVASRAHTRAFGVPFDKLHNPTKTVTGMAEYQVSKLANVLFTHALARRLEGSGVTTYSLHPGVVASEIWRRVPWPFRGLMTRFMITNEEGAMTSLHCATDPGAAKENGLYYDKCRPKKPNRAARDQALQEKLWSKSLEWTGAPDLPLA